MDVRDFLIFMLGFLASSRLSITISCDDVKLNGLAVPS